jgi:medium-chain acyl-[acyl-carrier-protein] hydrolase
MIYREWPTRLPANVEVNIVQLPGRWPRLSENAFTDYASLVRALKPNLLTYQDKPIAFFGHSMGAIISFELARSLRREDSIEPVHLFASGSPAPQFGGLKPRTYDLPDPEFIEELRRLNGTPKDVLENEELMHLMIPNLRADFQVCQTYKYVSEPPFRCPISVFGGLEDREVTRERLEALREETTGAFSVRILAGDHFFLHAATTPFLQAISNDLHSHRFKH